MPKGLQVTEVRRISFQRDMVKRGLRGTIETKKQEDGTFKAKMANQDIEASGKDEGDAVYNLKKIIQEKFTKGELGDIKQNMT